MIMFVFALLWCVTSNSNYVYPSDELKFNLHCAIYDDSYMSESLSAVDWCHSPLNINDTWNFFYDVLDNVIKSNIPVSHATRKRNIYMTRETMWLKNIKYHFWRKYCSTHAQADYHAFVHVRNELRSLTRSLHHNFEQSITANVQRNPKVFWWYAKSRLKTQTTYCDIQDSDGNLLHSDTAKATAFNQFFSSMKIVPIYHHFLFLMLSLL